MKKRILSIIIIAVLSCAALTSCTPKTAEVTSQSNPAETADASYEDFVEFYANGERVTLNTDQLQEVVNIAEYCADNTGTTMNTVITDTVFEESKNDGIAVRVNNYDEPRRSIVLIVSSSHGALASRGGASAHMVDSYLAGRLMEIAGLIETDTDSSGSLEVTQSNGRMIAMMTMGQSASVKEEDIEPIFALAGEINKNDNKVSVILSKGYVEAVRAQGVYIELYDQTQGSHITVYLPTGHEGVAVFDDKDAYNIADDTRKKLDDIASGYITAEIDFADDPLSEDTGIDITYFTKDFRTDVQTKKDVQAALIEATQNAEPLHEVDMSSVEGYDDIEQYAFEKGVVVTIANEDAPFKAFMTQEIDGKKFDLVYVNNAYYEIDESHLGQLGEILGISL